MNHINLSTGATPVRALPAFDLSKPPHVSSACSLIAPPGSASWFLSIGQHLFAGTEPRNHLDVPEVPWIPSNTDRSSQHVDRHQPLPNMIPFGGRGERRRAGKGSAPHSGCFLYFRLVCLRLVMQLQVERVHCATWCRGHYGALNSVALRPGDRFQPGRLFWAEAGSFNSIRPAFLSKLSAPVKVTGGDDG
ncbi:hypothetical protein SKAU_G00336930 [Synaphobranchus kaupii]|uniref:Uncharacterized protein n=1 Tax=Synaphobranchus kaupii TaxID=118154 RepID=A0A9Q1IIT7_SYNKA|nr:hypothetical protein SKAU_G00336930 [Synaphobranchus kaupii]